MSKAIRDKVVRGENVKPTELRSLATYTSVSTTSQGRDKDAHTLAADISRALGVPAKIHY